MRTLLCLFSFSLLLASVAALAGDDFPPPLEYDSPYTGLAYQYNTHDGLSTGALTLMSIETNEGELRVVISETESGEVVDLSLPSTGAHVAATYSSTEDPGNDMIELDWGTNKTITRVFDNDTKELLSSDLGSAVDTIPGTALHRALLEAFQEVHADLDAYQFGPIPPLHQRRLVGILEAPLFIERATAEIQPFFSSSYCHWGTPNNYQDCVACCTNENPEGGSHIFTIICNEVVGRFCEGPWCVAPRIACGATAIMFDVSACVAKACTGKSGDPNCHDPKPACSGQCQVSCYIGQHTVCGDCGTQFCCDWN